MSFPALYLAVQAAEHLPPLEEFGLSWSDLMVAPDLDVRWAIYRTESGNLAFGVLHVRGYQDFLDRVLG